jgi:hypothetical protein
VLLLAYAIKRKKEPFDGLPDSTFVDPIRQTAPQIAIGSQERSNLKKDGLGLCSMFCFNIAECQMPRTGMVWEFAQTADEFAQMQQKWHNTE